MRSNVNLLCAGLAAAAIAIPAAHAANPSVGATPMVPSYGEQVKLELRNFDWPTYLPATRYAVVGNVINVEYEYVTDGWAVSRPDFGSMALEVGELPPGNYTVSARIYDINKPNSPPAVVTTNLPVQPPADWGIYSIPQNPDAYQGLWAMVRSAVYYDPATMRATVAGNVIRVDFDYYGDAPTGGPAPAGSPSHGSVELRGPSPRPSPPQRWGRAKAGGAAAKYFSPRGGAPAAIPLVGTVPRI